MSWTFISDIHIRKAGDEREELLLKYLDYSEKIKAKRIFLVGDIFDLMVGDKKKYLDEYQVIFERLASLEQEIYIFDGNHDFHLKRLWKRFSKKFGKRNIYHFTAGEVFLYAGKKVWVSHGDDIELGNYTYKIYRFFMMSYFLRFLANYVVPHFIIHWFGERASRNSRKRNENRYNRPTNQEGLKERFRQAVIKVSKDEMVDIVVCGHSHIQENEELGKVGYLNNGYVPISKVFSMIDENANLSQPSLI